jgi:Protein of unknown function (DUF4435)/AAA domain, putative AbiEii toxin, Type IV TA system
MEPILTDLTNKEVSFPPSASVPSQVKDLQCQTSIVVVGANGSGKSRLGSWLEFKGPQKERVHRIAAQRSLVFPENSSPIGFEKARDAFHWAPVPSNWDRETYETGKAGLRLQHRYGGSLVNAETAPLSDFDALVTLLFSENYSALLEHEDLQRSTHQLVPMPDSQLRKVQALWESLLPSRSLRLGSSEVRVVQRTSPDSDYSARAMSDGERVIFYLIGQCLCARKDAIIVVDEPEIHLHKSIQDALWNAVEKARPDCAFVYLTHDLMFAADRIGATKVCVTEYSQGAFSWFSILAQNEIPEDIYLEVLGSRKPVLFVEGTSGSLDSAVYRLAFPRFTVKPLGSCLAVVAATKVFKSLEEMHHIKSFGIVDRDYLEQGQIDAYERAGIFVPLVAEVENLFLIPELIEAVAVQLLIDPTTALNEVKQYVLDDFRRGVTTHAMEITKHKVALMLGRFSSSGKNIVEFSEAFVSFRSEIEPSNVYATALAEAQAAIDANDYKLVLRLFNKKELSKNLGRFFGLTKGSYVDKVKEMAKRGLGNVPTHLKAYLPSIENHL